MAQISPVSRRSAWRQPSPPVPRPPARRLAPGYGRVYRPRRPTETPLYPVVQHHLETFLAEAREADPIGWGVPTWVERDLKNVAGFDLVRLAAGSRGALGVFHRVSLRLYPLPRTDRTLVWTRSELAEAVELGRHLARLPFALSVAGLEVQSGEGTPGSEPPGPRVLLRVAHSPEVVDRIEAEAARIAGEPELRVEGDASRQAARLRSEEEGAGSPFLLVQLLPDRLPALDARSVLPTAPGVRVAMRMDRGRVRLWGPGLEEDFGARVRALSEAAGELGGSFRVLRASRDRGGLAGRSAPEGAAGPAGAEAEASARAHGTPTNPAIARLHRELRHAFDPAGILPGAWREEWR